MCTHLHNPHAPHAPRASARSTGDARRNGASRRRQGRALPAHRRYDPGVRAAGSRADVSGLSAGRAGLCLCALAPMCSCASAVVAVVHRNCVACTFAPPALLARTGCASVSPCTSAPLAPLCRRSSCSQSSRRGRASRSQPRTPPFLVSCAGCQASFYKRRTAPIASDRPSRSVATALEPALDLCP